MVPREFDLNPHNYCVRKVLLFLSSCRWGPLRLRVSQATCPGSHRCSGVEQGPSWVSLMLSCNSWPPQYSWCTCIAEMNKWPSKSARLKLCWAWSYSCEKEKSWRQTELWARTLGMQLENHVSTDKSSNPLSLRFLIRENKGPVVMK